MASLCVVAPPQQAAAQDLKLLRQIEAANVRVIEKAEPAVVAIARVRKDQLRGRNVFDPIGRNGQNQLPGNPGFVPADFGAGVVIETRNPQHPRLILTNYHVIRGGPVFSQNEQNARFSLWVSMAGRPAFEAEIVAADPHSDLAALTIGSLEPNEVTPLKPTAYQPKKGQFVFAFGNPYAIAKDGSASVVSGIVSNVLRSPYANQPDWDNEFRLFDNVHQFGTLMQIGVSLPLGTSGGALVNMDGELIGITTSLAPLKGYEQSAGYAIPFTPGFIRVIEQLSMGYEVEYGFLGVRPADATPGNFTDLRPAERPAGGSVVLSVTAGSPAAIGGIQPGDVVVSVNGSPIHHSQDVMREVGLIGPNEEATLRVWRPRQRGFVDRKVRLAKWPVQNDADIIATAFKHPAWRGIRVDYSTSRAKFMRLGGAVEITRGVVVVDVDEKSQGIRIQPGDFITHVGDQAVTSPDEFRNAVKSRDEQGVNLRTNDGRTITIAP